MFYFKLVYYSDKKMLKKRVILLLPAILILIFLQLSFSSALLANFTNVTGSIERSLSTISSTNIINFTIGAISENITEIKFILTGSQNTDPDKFVIDSNGTNAPSVAFSNVSITNASMPGGSFTLILTFTNNSGAGIIPNGTTRNFWFNINSRSTTSSLISVLVNATGVSNTINQSSGGNSMSFPFSFRFSGYVKNESGGLQNATNITMYQFTNVPMGPPIETPVSSVLSNENGSFTFTGLSSSGGIMYTMKMIYYNASGVATKIGTILPPFPAEMYYPQSFSGGGEPAYEFMKPPSLNGSTFYLGPAATIYINATNGTTLQRFGYMIMDQKIGLQMESNMFGNVSNMSAIVPINKRYTVMLVRANQQFGMYATCGGSFMNDTACNTPPRSNSTIYPTVAGQITNVQLNLAINRVQMYGCIEVSGNSSQITNITSILPKMLPWEGFVPPMRPDNQDINLSSTAQLNYSDSRCSGKIAWYNISLLNSNYLVEFYGAKNASTSNSSEHVAAFQNVSYSGLSQGNNTMQNITLKPLAGAFVAEGNVNTTKIRINIQNSTGGAITQDTPHVDLFVRDTTTFGELTYIMDNPTNGTFYITLPANSTAKVKIFSNNAPPKEKTLNLSLSETNVTLISMTGGDGGFRKINSSGGMEAMNITSSTFAMQMKFIKAGGNCDGLYPDNSSCVLTSTTASGFNPMSAMVAGTINMEMKMTSSNTSITFYNFDMLAAKQPPMESVLNDQKSGGSANAPEWQFGSFVPADVYDYAIVAMPYSDTNINDSAQINISMSNLYDENWNVVWNSSRGDTAANFTNNVDEYLGNSNNRSYNSTGYRNFTVSGGVACSTSDSNLNGTSPSAYCFINTSSNIMYMRVPHFSGVAPLITATAPATAAAASDDDDDDDDSSSSSTAGYWSSTFNFADEEFSKKETIIKEVGKKQRIKLKISSAIHYVGVIDLTSTTVTINVSSIPQQAILGIGEEKKFEIDEDDFYDVLVKLNNFVNGRANLSVSYLHEETPTQPLPPAENSTLGSNETAADTNNANLDGNTAESGEGTKSRRWIWILIIIVIVLAAGGIIGYRYLKKESYKYHRHSGSFYA